MASAGAFGDATEVGAAGCASASPVLANRTVSEPKNPFLMDRHRELTGAEFAECS
jgi:hypothetical protein